MGKTEGFKMDDAPLLIVMGQSNAHGHGTRLYSDEIPKQPYSNVFGLERSLNQSYGIKKVTWSPFRMSGMNLGETQDNTCCLAGEFARLWQDEIDEGKKLPDLYVIQISIGSQGIDKAEINGDNMWWPNRSEILQPGLLGTVNISLYPLATHILKLSIESLRLLGKNPIILGLHWNQWETEVSSGGDVLKRAKDNYNSLFNGFYNALGCRCKTYLYWPLSQVYNNETGREALQGHFRLMEQENSNIRIINIQHSALWDEIKENKGIYQEDLVHYNREAQKWFAWYQYNHMYE